MGAFVGTFVGTFEGGAVGGSSAKSLSNVTRKVNTPDPFSVS